MTVLASRSDEVDRFVHEIFAAERPALNGRRDFVEDLTLLLTRWELGESLGDVLGVWTAIEIDQAMCAAIASLRDLGFPCYLASNQEAHRGRHMTETLRYRDMFHREYYSHRLGVAKPDAAYFRAILADLQMAPEDLLFIDDHKSNVTAAREVGLQAAVFAPGKASGVETLRAILSAHGIALV
jgi:putative hydrolase of the HAD superfamily